MNISILETCLKYCHKIEQLEKIFSRVIISGMINDTYAASRFIKYSTESRFVHINFSRKVFDHLENSSGFIWNTMMRAYMQINCHEQVFMLYKLMLRSSIDPDNCTYPILVHASALQHSGPLGKQVHDHVLKMGFDYDVYVLNTLINFYVVCGNVRHARKIFDESFVLDLVSWNSLLAGYVHVGDVEEAKYIFDQMPERNTVASNSMIALFGKMRLVNEAENLFYEMRDKDIVSWSAIMSCYEQNNLHEEALNVFIDMRTNGVLLDDVAIVSVLSACSHLSVEQTGMAIHGLAIKIASNVYISSQNALIHMYSTFGAIDTAEKLFNANCSLDQVSWNSMVSGYMKCGSIDKARKLFDSMAFKDIVSWSAIISGYVQNSRFTEAMSLFHHMQSEKIDPDETILASVISACTHLHMFDEGKKIHSYIQSSALSSNNFLGTTLIDMYMKCGDVENGLDIFDGMEEKRVASWNALIIGLSMNGFTESSLQKFLEMREEGAQPNEITFLAVLGACCHMGLVFEGRKYFSLMIQEYNIEPSVKHYGCMVDLLGRNGLLKEAEEIIESMPMIPDVATWGALLGACKKHGDRELGERIGRKLVEQHPDHDGFHVLLSNIYASTGNWEDVLEVRGKMVRRRVLKSPGCSLIEAD